MAELTGALEIDGLRVERARAVPAAALRYLTRDGRLCRRAWALRGCPCPSAGAPSARRT